MKFFPVSSVSITGSTTDPLPITQGSIMRVTSNEFVRIFVGTIFGSVGCFGVRPGKAYYHRVPNNNKNTEFTVTNESGTAETNVSFSPDMGGEFDWLPVNKCTINSQFVVNDRPAVGAIGRLNVVREELASVTVLQFNADATADSMYLVSDETFYVPNATYVTSASTSNEKIVISGVT